MATCREIITAAARKVGDVSEGKPAPSAYTSAVMLDVLQGWYDQIVNTGLFGRLTDVYVSADYEAKEFERIRKDATATITYPTVITDDPCSDPRVPYDLALVVVAGATPEHHLYDGQLGSWVRLDGLTLDTEAPLSRRSRDGLASALAVQVCEDAGIAPGAVLSGKAQRFATMLSLGDGSPRRPAPAEFF
jgi:hypothetical protein